MSSTRTVLGLLLAMLVGVLDTLSTAIVQDISIRDNDVIGVTAVVYSLLIIYAPAVTTASQAPLVLAPMTALWTCARTVTTIAANISLYTATLYLPLGDVLIFTCLSIPLTSIGSAWILGEKTKILDGITLILTITGAGLLMLPAIRDLGDAKSWNTVVGSMLGTGAAVLYATSNISYCYTLRRVNQWTVIAYLSIIFGMTGVILAVLTWRRLDVCMGNTLDRLLIFVASGTIFWNSLFVNLVFKLTTAGLGTQTYFATHLISGFVVQVVGGYGITWWSGSGAGCVGLALLLNIIYYFGEMTRAEMDTILEVRDKSKEKLTEMTDKSKEKLTEMTDKSKEKLTEMTDKSKEKFTEMTDKSKDKFIKITDRSKLGFSIKRKHYKALP